MRPLSPFLSALLVALLTKVGRADSPPAVVWYRASEACPSGADFLARLGARAATTKLAGPGDHIDFVVTLVATAAETVGRLERQTQAGTVAIRELRDASCERVADALSLGLALSLPNSSEAATTDSDASPVEPRVEPAPANPLPKPPPQSTVEPPQRPARARPLQPEAKRAAASGRLGAQGGALVGVMPELMGRAEVHLELDGLWPQISSHPFLRMGALASFGSTHPPLAGRIREWIGAGRLQGCPWRLRKAGASAFPCLAAEIGAMGVSNARTAVSSVGWWLAAAAGLGARVDLSQRFALEAEAELQLPLLRYEIAEDSRVLYRSAPLTFQAGLGISARLW